MSNRKWWKIVSQEQEWFGDKRRQEHLRYDKIKAAESRRTIMKKRMKLGSQPNHLKIKATEMMEREHRFDKAMEI